MALRKREKTSKAQSNAQASTVLLKQATIDLVMAFATALQLPKFDTPLATINEEEFGQSMSALRASSCLMIPMQSLALPQFMNHGHGVRQSGNAHLSEILPRAVSFLNAPAKASKKAT